MANLRFKSVWLRIQTIGVLVALNLAVVVFVDQHNGTTETRPPHGASSTESGELPPKLAGRPRAFVLLIDSLRYQSATDPALMPKLNDMMDRSVYAKVRSSADAVTRPALRVAFTGRRQFKVLGFVDNFRERTEAQPSLFSELVASGRSAAVYSSDFFYFHKYIANYDTNRGPRASSFERETRQAPETAAAHLEGEHDLTVMHVTYIDDHAHAFGVHSEEYRISSAAVDRLIQQIDGIIPEDESFFVVGDHGHNDDGVHALGLDVPTFLLARGPGLHNGVNLGYIDIEAYRYLLSWALHLPLGPGYEGPMLTEALSGKPPFGRYEANDPNDPSPSLTTVALDQNLRSNGIDFLLIATLVGLVLCLTTLCIKEFGVEQRFPILGTGAIWLILLTVFADGFSRRSLVCAILVGTGVALQQASRHFLLGRSVFLLGSAVTVAVAFYAWGWMLAELRPLVHTPEYPLLAGLWLAYLAICGLVAARWGVVAGTWLLLAGPALLLYPSVYRYGSSAAFAPAWCGWTLFVLVQAFRRNSGHGGLKNRLTSLLLAGGILILVQHFFFPSSVNFSFDYWILFPGVDLLESAVAPIMLGACCLIVYGRLDQGWKLMVLATLLAAWSAALTLGTLESHRSVSLVVTILLATAAAVQQKLNTDPESKQATRDMLLMGAAFSAYIYFVRVPTDRYQMAVMLLAAAALSGRLLRAAKPTPRELQAHYVFLLAVGVLVCGWVTLSWGVYDLEWRFAYDYFAADSVYYAVIAFLPIMVFRYCLPLIILYLLLARELPADFRKPTHFVYGVVAVKLGSVMLIQLGLGHHGPTSTVYLEAVYHATILLIFFIVVVFTLDRLGHPAREAA